MNNRIKSVFVVGLMLVLSVCGCSRSYEYDDLSDKAAHYFTIDGAAGGGIALSKWCSKEMLAEDIYKITKEFNDMMGTEDAHISYKYTDKWYSFFIDRIKYHKEDEDGHLKFNINEERLRESFMAIYTESYK
ncbi:MAG TPA: hypothetical protein PKV16_04155 [Caldisericia bacterium]|nr:hypothetical protein [Caldisericia bacterium]HPF48502.1 hypothetical protein [Caldisericia bacterium]HPI83317.1 hypothetical protein [Caldisericia bacterium]HPQ92957.1 hypothetical protein [Caldisericia bacterium]HRV75209.1 hypothetical protein [Caldisericia bacterium]